MQSGFESAKCNCSNEDLNPRSAGPGDRLLPIVLGVVHIHRNRSDRVGTNANRRILHFGVLPAFDCCRSFLKVSALQASPRQDGGMIRGSRLDGIGLIFRAGTPASAHAVTCRHGSHGIRRQPCRQLQDPGHHADKMGRMNPWKLRPRRKRLDSRLVPFGTPETDRHNIPHRSFHSPCRGTESVGAARKQPEILGRPRQVSGFSHPTGSACRRAANAVGPRRCPHPRMRPTGLAAVWSP